MILCNNCLNNSKARYLFIRISIPILHMFSAKEQWVQDLMSFQPILFGSGHFSLAGGGSRDFTTTWSPQCGSSLV